MPGLQRENFRNSERWTLQPHFQFYLRVRKHGEIALEISLVRFGWRGLLLLGGLSRGGEQRAGERQIEGSRLLSCLQRESNPHQRGIGAQQRGRIASQ